MVEGGTNGSGWVGADEVGDSCSGATTGAMLPKGEDRSLASTSNTGGLSTKEVVVVVEEGS